jgi:LEA14-like dessication related protein
MTRFGMLLGTLVSATLLLTACGSLPHKPEPPRVSLIGLNLLSVDLFEQRYALRLRIKNPNAFELPVRGVDFQLDINGEVFADGVSNRAFTVPAFGESVLELEVSSSLLQVFEQLRALQGDAAAGLAYRVRGNVAVGSYGQRLPFDHTGELTLPDAAPPAGGKGA